MKILSGTAFALLLPLWLFGKLYLMASKEPFTIRAFLLSAYAFPAVKLCEIYGISMAWPVIWIPFTCLCITKIIDAAISHQADQPDRPQ